MTRQEIVAEITKRVGDPNAVAFGTDTWNYFMEAVYEIYPTITDVEKRYLTDKNTINLTTDNNGYATCNPASLGIMNDLYGVNVNGYPAKMIDREQFYLMKTNDNYVPYGNEAYYIFEEELKLLTGVRMGTITVDIYYLMDIYNSFGMAEDNKQITINSSLIFKAIPVAARKLKEQVMGQM